MKDEQMLAATMGLPDPDLLTATKITDPIGAGSYYRADTVVRLLSQRLKVWCNTDFEGVWGVGTAAVVVASTRQEAEALLNAELASRYLPESAKADDFYELPLSEPTVLVLNDGDY